MSPINNTQYFVLQIPIRLSQLCRCLPLHPSLDSKPPQHPQRLNCWWSWGNCEIGEFASADDIFEKLIVVNFCQISHSSSEARSDDTSKAKSNTTNLVMEDVTKALDPPIKSTGWKEDCSVKHPVLQKMLCPLHLILKHDHDTQWVFYPVITVNDRLADSASRFWAKVETNRYQITAKKYSVFLYKNNGTNNTRDSPLDEGLTQGYFLLRISSWLHCVSYHWSITTYCRSGNWYSSGFHPLQGRPVGRVNPGRSPLHSFFT